MGAEKFTVRFSYAIKASIMSTAMALSLVVSQPVYGKAANQFQGVQIRTCEHRYDDITEDTPVQYYWVTMDVETAKDAGYFFEASGLNEEGIDNGLPNDLIPHIALVDMDGQIIAENDRADGTLQAKLQTAETPDASSDVVFSLPYSGRYGLIVSAYSGTGRFGLSLSGSCGAGPGDTDCSNIAESDELPNHHDPGYRSYVGLVGTKGQVVEITIRRTSGNLLPDLQLHEPSTVGDTNEEIANPAVFTAKNVGRARNIVLQTKLKYDGTYGIVAAATGNTSGKYTLTCRTLANTTGVANSGAPSTQKSAAPSVFPCSQAGIGITNLCVLAPYPVKRGTTARVVWKIASFKSGSFDMGDGRGFVGPIYAEMQVSVPDLAGPRLIQLKWIDRNDMEHVDALTIQVTD